MLTITPPVITDSQLQELAETVTVREGLVGELICLLQKIRTAYAAHGTPGLSFRDRQRLKALGVGLDQKVSLELYQALLETGQIESPRLLLARG
jgi:hypothetical protein